MQLTLAAAFIAGLISFVSPCVLPVVPAYLGQLGVVAATPGARWRALPHAVAFVLGFGAVFILLGLTVYVGGSLLGLTLSTDALTALRRLGGFALIVLGLNLAGILRFDYLQRSWRPLDAVLFRRAATVSLAIGSAEAAGGPGIGGATMTLDRPAAASLGRSPVGAFGLGAIFSLGWTPCIGPTLGAVLELSAGGPNIQVVALFAAYSVGLAVPFLAMALALDRSRAVTAPLLRHGRLVDLVGGLLVAGIGVAILFDWLSVLAGTFSFLTPSI